MDAKPRLLDHVRDRIRVLHYSYRTEQQYVAWIRRFTLFHGKRHPQSMGAAEVEAFLTHLARDRNVAAATQSPAPARQRPGLRLSPARRARRQGRQGPGYHDARVGCRPHGTGPAPIAE